jgi:hypothetical protein
MGPNFLCIGAQKSGTTWLHDNLSRHPNVWLPPVKEIHYFDRPHLTIHARLFGRASRLRRARAHLGRTSLAFCRGRASAGELRWALRYCFGPRSDAWYAALFDHPGKVTGEICPGYARLPKSTIQRIGGLMPEGKIIFLLRHPIERAWSAAVMHFSGVGPKDIGKADPVEVIAWLMRAKTQEHAGYTQAIENWRSVFEDRLLIGFYDELCSNPAELLARIQAFIGVAEAIPVDVGTARNAGNWVGIPSPFLSLLEDSFRPEIERLHGLLGHPITREWLNRRYGSERPALKTVESHHVG